MPKSNNRGPKQSQPVWDTLAGLSGAVGQVTNITAILIPFLQDKELLDRISDKARFNRLATTLERDVRDMTVRFRSINNQHAGRHGHSNDPTDVMTAIDIQEQYVEWASSWDDVVHPTFKDMLELLKAAGADITGVFAPSASGLAAAQDN